MSESTFSIGQRVIWTDPQTKQQHPGVIERHDPLCDWLQTQCTTETCDSLRMGDHCEHEWCQCDLIAKVRADELHQIRDTVQQAAQEAAFTPSMNGLFDAVELIDGAIKDLGGGNEPAVA